MLRVTLICNLRASNNLYFMKLQIHELSCHEPSTNLLLCFSAHLHLWALRSSKLKSSTSAQWKTDFWALQALLLFCCPLAPEQLPNFPLLAALWFTGVPDCLFRLFLSWHMFCSLLCSFVFPHETRRPGLLAMLHEMLHHDEHKTD